MVSAQSLPKSCMKINEKLVNSLNWMIIYFFLINFHPLGFAFSFRLRSLSYDGTSRPNKSGLPILPHLLRQMPSRIGDYSGTTSSPAERGFRYAQLAYLRQPRQSLKLGYSYPYQCFPIFFVCHFSLTYIDINKTAFKMK